MPALPPLMVELKASISDFQSKFGTAEKQIGSINRKGGGDLAKLQSVGKAAFLGLGTAAVAFGGIAINEALQQEAANARLTQSLKNVGSNLTAMSPAFQKAQADARKLGFSDDEATDSLSKLVAATKNPTKALTDLSIAQNVARGRGIDLASATDILTKVETGHVAMLGRIGINVKDATGATISQEEAVRRLAGLYGGQASAFSQTFAGRMATLKAETSDLAERVGFVLIPKIEALAHAGAGAVEWAQKHQTAAKALGAVIAGPLVLAMGAYIAAQTATIVRSGVLVALKLPQFFLAVGAAVRGTTASEVVLNETMASTFATTAMGAGVVGILAGGVFLLTQRWNQSAAAAKNWAAEQIAGIPGVRRQLDETNRLIELQQKKVDEVHGSWRMWVGFLSQFTSITDHEDRLKSLRKQAEALSTQLKNMGGDAAAAGHGLDDMAGSVDDATKDAADFASRLDSLRSNLMGVVSANKAHKDAQAGVATATDRLTDAHRKLDDLLARNPVDLRAVAEAQKEYERSTKTLTDAREGLAAAEQNMQKVQAGAKPRDIERAQIAAREAQRRYDETLGDSKSTVDDVETALLDLADANDRVTEIQNQGKPGTDEYKEAQKRLADATQGVKAAEDGQREAQEKLTAAQQPDIQLASDIAAAKDGLKTAEENLAGAKDAVTTSEWNLYEAQRKGNEELGKSPDLIANLKGSLDDFVAKYPGGANLAAGISGLLPSAADTQKALYDLAVKKQATTPFKPAAGNQNDDLTVMKRGGANPVPAHGDIVLHVDGKELARTTQTQLLQQGRNNVSLLGKPG